MATNIETLKKSNGDKVLPRTRAKAVSMENGTTVEAVIGNINEQLNDAMSKVLPAVTSADNGKVLMVVDGKWQMVTLNLTVDENGVVSM
jgi:hypothetical protein